ncbi:hypothetical protein R3P38DRAFT_2772119 [Favolaschia claudopus]|uniref:Uncharacterized protein n=1 Tax=Favolaschia claudopus TaxID=2862362 RepID=A0AAW0C8Z6_9AGAR
MQVEVREITGREDKDIAGLEVKAKARLIETELTAFVFPKRHDQTKLLVSPVPVGPCASTQIDNKPAERVAGGGRIQSNAQDLKKIGVSLHQSVVLIWVLHILGPMRTALLEIDPAFMVSPSIIWMCIRYLKNSSLELASLNSLGMQRQPAVADTLLGPGKEGTVAARSRQQS